MPAAQTGFPNGLALDEHHGVLYAADSVLGTVWRIPTKVGSRGCAKPAAWATGTKLHPPTAPAEALGANGVKVRHGAAWVANVDKGLLLRIPVKTDGTADPIETRATGLRGIDDFEFTGGDNTVLAALIFGSEVAAVRPDGTHAIVLTSRGGLSNPTSVAIQGKTVYVPSAAFFTMKNPNLLLATRNKHHG
ncbi:hypothetical protein [Streptomyces chryseus]|uniref:SMP-30/Gluconolactonase/LRE-like region domain-containing protein n=1 Tax=Streptomyces chryseus TaxID=68186 RepID=A0ABQ3EC90_9ACTN|nr:hypothetical protein [Streptomyces chryseus]GHB33151.1 hypothetical protein GCM10010346_65450 [Streptomyces chryseus]